MDNKKQTDDVETQGFSEDELADIMSEIEDLESDLEASESEAKAEVDEKVEDEIVEEVVSKKKITEPQKEVLVKLVDMPSEKMVPTSVKNECHEVGAQTAMDFQVSGQMTLNMNFHVGGQSIKLSVNEGNGLEIEMAGGVKFVVPIANKNSVKKAA